MSDLQSRLQTAVGDTYRIEKELGGGGMSRVFLAEEVRLGRKVVIKVLPPEMGAGVNAERFEREIQLAAKLQHPHVVPLLTAGSSEDLLYYMMPYIEGESLRAKLAREGELPVSDAVKILKEVVDALAYAHRHGVVHRDIKPDNVLLSEGHATVTDFGVAKAMSASTGESSLTSLGVALGTPAYMAPEQAVADPHVDHRADIYAVGAMAYEMLTGRPPFTGPNPQAVLSAHVTDAPEPATKFRTTVPESLNALVMRCLEKKPADRWQRAEELLPHLDAILTPTGGITPTGTAPVPAVDYEALARQAHPVRVAVLFGIASAVVLAIVYFIMLQLGLPDWVFVSAVMLLAVGLPIMLMTGHHERQRALARTTGIVVTTPQQGIRRLFTWRKSLVGGGLAFAGLGVVATIYMAMRLLGIGPAATLVTSGVLEERELIILADFTDRTGDSSTAAAVTEAFRVDLGQSPMVTLMSSSELQAALERMGQDPATSLDIEVAREVATREGIKAVIGGEINALGTGYVVSVRLVAPEEGKDLVAFRETAKDATELIPAIDRLSKQLRERIGESLKTIRTDPPLDRVSTASLAALRKYSEAIRAETAGELTRATALLGEAVAIDTGFAMAYRKIGTIAVGRGERARWVGAMRKAFAHRTRLTDQERYLTLGTYYYYVEGDRESAIAAYRTLLDMYPDSRIPQNNLAIIYSAMGQREQAEQLYLQAIERTTFPAMYTNLAGTQAALGKFGAAEETINQLAERFPGHAGIEWGRSRLAAARLDYDQAEAHLRALREAERGSVRWRAVTSNDLARLAQLRGELTRAARHYADAADANLERGLEGEYLVNTIERASIDVILMESPSRGLAAVETALQEHSLSTIPSEERPYLDLAWFYADAGRPELGRAALAEYQTEVDAGVRRQDEWRQHAAAGNIALADGRWEQAIEEFGQMREKIGCTACGLPGIARAFDLADQSDSAIATYERYLAAPSAFRIVLDSRSLASTYKRLGELYEKHGDSQKAVEYYDRFVELWKDADEELQPVVRDVRARIARLVGER